MGLFKNHAKAAETATATKPTTECRTTDATAGKDQTNHTSDEVGHEKVQNQEEKHKHHFWERHGKEHGKDGGSKSASPKGGDPLGEGNLGQGLVWR